MDSWAFVEYDGSKLSEDPAVRRRVRQYAMRDVATARRRKGNYGKQNLRQAPPWLTELRRVEDSHVTRDQQGSSSQFRSLSINHSSQLYSLDTPTRQEINNDHSRHNMKHRCIVPKPLETSFLGGSIFALLQKVPMAGLRLGITPVSHQFWLATANASSIEEPQVGSRTFISYVPSRYGQVPCLTLAVDCVVAKMRHLLSGSSPGNSPTLYVALGSYNKALRAVQAALNDTVSRMSPETLCAIELLGIFEVRTFFFVSIIGVDLLRLQFLNGGENLRHWVHHVGGAARLIEARGFERFASDFEISLFMESIGSTVRDQHRGVTDS